MKLQNVTLQKLPFIHFIHLILIGWSPLSDRITVVALSFRVVAAERISNPRNGFLELGNVDSIDKRPNTVHSYPN